MICTNSDFSLCHAGWTDEYLSLPVTGTYFHRAASLVLLVLLFPRKAAAVRRLLAAEGSRDKVLSMHKALAAILNVNLWRGVLKY